jgi:hypothetical protein
LCVRAEIKGDDGDDRVARSWPLSNLLLALAHLAPKPKEDAMRHLAALLTLMPLVAGCGHDEARPAGPSAIPSLSLPAPQPAPPTFAPRHITLGEAVTDTLMEHGAHRVFDLTTPSDGPLVARLSWDRRRGSLELWLDDTQFVTYVSPTVGKLRVAAGRTYRIRVEDASPWDYDTLVVPFTLATARE